MVLTENPTLILEEVMKNTTYRTHKKLVAFALVYVGRCSYANLLLPSEAKAANLIVSPHFPFVWRSQRLVSPGPSRIG